VYRNQIERSMVNFQNWNVVHHHRNALTIVFDTDAVVGDSHSNSLHSRDVYCRQRSPKFRLGPRPRRSRGPRPEKPGT
jgi:hypothetical protein